MKLLRLTYVFYLEKRYEYQRTKMDERGVWQTSSTTPIMRTFIRCNASYVLKTGGCYLEPRKSWHNHETSRAKIRIVMYQSQGHLFFYLGCGHSRSIQYHHLQAFVCLDCTNSRRGREDSSRDPKIVIWEKKQNRGVSKTRARRCVETSLLPNWLRPYSTSFYRHAVPISSTSTVCLIDIFREDYDYWVQDYRSSFQKPYIIHSSSGPPNHPHIKFIIWRSIQIINHINHTTYQEVILFATQSSIHPSAHPLTQSINIPKSITINGIGTCDQPPLRALQQTWPRRQFSIPIRSFILCKDTTLIKVDDMVLKEIALDTPKFTWEKTYNKSVYELDESKPPSTT